MSSASGRGKGSVAFSRLSVKEGGVCCEKEGMSNQNQSNRLRAVFGGVWGIMRGLAQNSFQCNALREKQYLMKTPIQQSIKRILKVKYNLKIN